MKYTAPFILESWEGGKIPANTPFTIEKMGNWNKEIQVQIMYNGKPFGLYPTDILSVIKEV
jgi:hypothetical protein